jgi:hypothetical protein
MQGYTTFSAALALVATGLGMVVVWQLWRAPRPEAAEPLPIDHRLPLALIAMLPVLIWAFGLVAASAVFSLLWVLRWENRRPGNLVVSLAIAAAVAGLTALYLDRFAVVRLPDAAIMALF